jgi:hypothetical protein
MEAYRVVGTIIGVDDMRDEYHAPTRDLNSDVTGC